MLTKTFFIKKTNTAQKVMKTVKCHTLAIDHISQRKICS